MPTLTSLQQFIINSLRNHNKGSCQHFGHPLRAHPKEEGPKSATALQAEF